MFIILAGAVAFHGRRNQYLDNRQQADQFIVEHLGMVHNVPKKTDLLQGTLDLLILRTLALGPLHGWGIAKRIQQMSDEVLRANQGSLYPALYRLEDRGLITAQWGVSPEGRRAKFYALTGDGLSQLEAERASWRRFAAAVEAILAAT